MNVRTETVNRTGMIQRIRLARYVITIFASSVQAFRWDCRWAGPEAGPPIVAVGD
jgi:hypothetical protein